MDVLFLFLKARLNSAIITSVALLLHCKSSKKQDIIHCIIIALHYWEFHTNCSFSAGRICLFFFEFTSVGFFLCSKYTATFWEVLLHVNVIMKTMAVFTSGHLDETSFLPDCSLKTFELWSALGPHPWVYISITASLRFWMSLWICGFHYRNGQKAAAGCSFPPFFYWFVVNSWAGLGADPGFI